MPILLTLLVGGLAGVLAVRMMNLNVDVFVAIAIGVIGAIFGSVALRSLIGVFAASSNVLSIFIGGIVGAVALIALYRFFNPPKA